MRLGLVLNKIVFKFSYYEKILNTEKKFGVLLFLFGSVLIFWWLTQSNVYDNDKKLYHIRDIWTTK